MAPRRRAPHLIALRLLAALGASRSVDSGGATHHPALASEFLVRCQKDFKRCEDRVVDVAISLIMTDNPQFCDPRKDDPEELTRLVTDWMSSRPEQPGETATQGIADALFHVRPCVDGASMKPR